MAARIRCRPSGVRPRRFKRFSLPARTRRGLGKPKPNAPRDNQPERASVRFRNHRNDPHITTDDDGSRAANDPLPNPLHMGEEAGRNGKRETSTRGLAPPG
jgi:hypothetical protein